MTEPWQLSLFGEILPRLGCVNLVVAGEGLEEVSVGGDTITVAGHSFSVAGYEFEKQISGLVRSSQGLTCRLKLLNCDRLPGLINPEAEQTFRKLRFPPPRLDLGVEYELECQCGAGLGQVSPARVLPLPSVSWKSNSLDWEVSFSLKTLIKTDGSLFKMQFLLLSDLGSGRENVTSYSQVLLCEQTQPTSPSIPQVSTEY